MHMVHGQMDKQAGRVDSKQLGARLLAVQSEMLLVVT